MKHLSLKSVPLWPRVAERRPAVARLVVQLKARGEGDDVCAAVASTTLAHVNIDVVHSAGRAHMKCTMITRSVQ